MPDLSLETWILIGAAALLVIGLVVAVATRAGRQQQQEEQRQEQQIRRSQTLRVVSIVILLVVIVTFAVVNSDNVSIDWVFTETNAPMVLVIALSGGIGFLVGALVASRRSE